MRFSILGALLGTVALAGAGGLAITQTSATNPLRVSDTSPLGRLATTDPVTSPPTTSPAEYTAETRVVKRRGVSYLNVSVTYEGPAFFTVEQRVCARRSCTTTNAELTVIGGKGETTARLGRGPYRKRGRPNVAMAPLPTVTIRETVTITEPGPTVTVTEPGPTVTVTCHPYADPTEPPQPSETLPTEEPTDAPTDLPTETPTDAPTESPTSTDPTEPPTPPVPAPSDDTASTVTPTDAVTPTELPTDPAEIPTCPPPTEDTPAEPSPDDPTDPTPTQ